MELGEFSPTPDLGIELIDDIDKVFPSRDGRGRINVREDGSILDG